RRSPAGGRGRGRVRWSRCRSRRSGRGSRQARFQLLAVGVLTAVGDRTVPRDRPTRHRHRALGRAADERSCLIAMTGPADLSDVRTGNVLYWREQDALSALFRRLTVTDVDTDTVHLVDDRDDPHVFDRATAQVRWPDGLGRSYLEAPSAEVDSDYAAYVADKRLRDAAHELSRIPASVVGDLAMRSDEVERLEAAITAWKLARQPEEDA